MPKKSVAELIISYISSSGAEGIWEYKRILKISWIVVKTSIDIVLQYPELLNVLHLDVRKLESCA